MNNEDAERFNNIKFLLSKDWIGPLIDRDIMETFHEELLKASAYYIKNEAFDNNASFLSPSDEEEIIDMLADEELQNYFSHNEYQRVIGKLKGNLIDNEEPDEIDWKRQDDAERIKDFRS